IPRHNRALSKSAPIFFKGVRELLIPAPPGHWRWVPVDEEPAKQSTSSKVPRSGRERQDRSTVIDALLIEHLKRGESYARAASAARIGKRTVQRRMQDPS